MQLFGPGGNAMSTILSRSTTRQMGGRAGRAWVLNATLALLVAAATSLVGVAATATSASASSTSSLYGWGLNANSQLGNGNTTNALSPFVITLPSGVTPVAGAGGADHTLMIGSDGNLYAWGYNGYGQLGIGNLTQESTPVKVSMPAGVIPLSVAAGNDHSLAIGSDGKIYAWGHNSFGQLGNGTTTDSHVPIAISLPAGVSARAIAAEGFSSMALGSDGNVYTWGDGANGALGNGGTANQNTPVKVSLPAGVTATAIAAERHSAMAIGSNGVLYAWGVNTDGELGNGTTTQANSPVAVSMPGGVTASAIAGGGAHSLAVGSNGLLYAWGYNAYGQVGNGTTAVQKTPVQIALPSGVDPVAVTAGMDSSYTIGSDGTLYAWGYNGDGELGNGGTTNGKTPAPVSLPALSLPATAVFSGSSAEAGFAIATTTPVPTTTTVSASASTAVYGQSVTITATVAPNDGGGTVEFLNGSNPVPGCTAVSLTLSGGNQQAQCSTSSLVIGSYVFKAKYSGDSNYAGSTSSGVGAGLTVVPAPLVVSPLSASTTYGSAAPTITPSYSGFVNGDSAASLTTLPTCSTAVTAATPVGSYSSSCSGASDPNYTISYQVGTITVEPAPLSIAASSGTMTYGGTAPTITASYSGFVNGDSAASLTTPPTCGTTATSSSPVGNYASTCSGAVDPNYSISYTNGTVAVGAAQLVITASSSSTTYGSDPPAVTPSYSGFVNGDTVASLTTPADLLDHGHGVEPGGELLDQLLGRSRPELHHHVLERQRRGGSGTAHDHGVVGHVDLRRFATFGHPVGVRPAKR